MDIQILDSWLRDHLKTNATYKDIAKYLTLCGPSIEKIDIIKNNGKTDYVYHIEVTTNRVDMMSVRGIAREASVILPEFGFDAELLPLETDSGTEYVKSDIQMEFKNDPKIVDRLMGVIMEIGKIGESPDWIKTRLDSTGMRSLNNIVDITNYIMTEIGQPTHVFDYDLVEPLISVRESKKGEKVTSFDGKTYSLPGGDIVFENDQGTIIDLPGIIGTKNSVVNQNTKRILFFIDNNDPVRIRKTSMTLGIRTVAATLNEKNVDPELAETALKRGLKLYKQLCSAKQVSKIYDVYSNKPEVKTVKVGHSFIEKILGVKIEEDKVLRILNNLGINSKVQSALDNRLDKVYVCIPPTYRSKDIRIPQDIAEEVARIYGYHNLPSTLMAGEIPVSDYDSPFEFETTIRRLLSALGGDEVYTLSLISEAQIEGNPLKLKNPLGKDTEYLRTSLKNSLMEASISNSGITESSHLFEIANTYTPQKNILPLEIMHLAGIFNSTEFRKAKGVIETFLQQLHIDINFVKEDTDGFIPSTCISIRSGSQKLGVMGYVTNSELIYYDFEVEKLRKLYRKFPKFVPIPKFPPQIEDMTFIVPSKTSVGEILNEIKDFSDLINNVELIDVYNDSYTFRLWYQSPEKTLTDNEIGQIKEKLALKIKAKYKTDIK